MKIIQSNLSIRKTILLFSEYKHISTWHSISDMPSMCVPVLEMDGGNKMPETMAIARYLAREFGKSK